jgi:hypothetical protein
MNKYNAIQLADALDANEHVDQALVSAELRRLYSVVLDITESHNHGSIYRLRLSQLVDALRKEREALLDALQIIAGDSPSVDNLLSDKAIAHAAIKKSKDPWDKPTPEHAEDVDG